MDLELTRQAFEARGFAQHLDVARDGQEALAYLRRACAAGHLPRLVLLDLNMPRVNGLEVLSTVRKRGELSGVPFVVFSTTTQDEERERSLSLGARDFQTKPANFDDLLGLVEVWAKRFLA